MTALDDVFRNIVIRRPPLQRWSIFDQTLPVLQEFIALYYSKYKEWCRVSLPKVKETLKELDKYFDVALNKELNVILGCIETLFKIASDYLYDVLISGKPNVETLFQDSRVVLLLNKSILGLSLDHWMKLPLFKLIEHVIDHTVFIHTHKKVTNSFIHHRLKLVVRSFASSRSADDLIKLMQESDVMSTLVPLKKIMTRFATNYWLERDVYFELAQSVLVIPQELILCVNNELHAQKQFDREQRASFNKNMNQLFAVSEHGHKSKHTRKNLGGTSSSDSKCDSSATETAAEESNRKKTTFASSSENHIIVSELDASDSYITAKQKLLEAENLTARLVEWYKTSGELANHQKQKKHADHATSFARFNRRPLTDEQQRATDEVKSLRNELHNKFKMSVPTTTTDNPALTLMDFSTLEIVCACLSPLHIYHKQWSGTERFVALTHHLHMFDVLVTRAHSMTPTMASRYCRHLKDIPLLSIHHSAGKCELRNNLNCENVCGAVYGLNDEWFPQKTLIRLRQCGDYQKIKQWAKKNKQTFKNLRKQYHKHVPQKTHSSSRLSSSSQSSRRSRKKQVDGATTRH